MRQKIGLDFVLGECVSLLERNDSDLIRQRAANRRLRGGVGATCMTRVAQRERLQLERTFTARTYFYSENVRLQLGHTFTAKTYVYRENVHVYVYSQNVGLKKDRLQREIRQ